jgi:hypothetical protein
MRVLRVHGGCAATMLSRVCLLMHTGVAARCSSRNSLPRTTAPVLWHHCHAGHALSHTRLCASHRPCAAAAICNDHPMCTIDAEKQAPPPVLQTMVCIRGAIYGVQIAPRIQTMVCIRDAICTPYTNHGFVKGVQIASLVTNHGLYTGCKLHPENKPWFVQRDAICTPYTNHGLAIGCAAQCTAGDRLRNVPIVATRFNLVGMSGNHCQNIWWPACHPHSTHDHKPWP